jgi:hypothetical protein
VYMYFNPSWSHAHSAFMVTVFLWYWIRTRAERTWKQWLLLGLVGGLMVDVYYINWVLLLFPLLESIGGYQKAWRASKNQSVQRLLWGNACFAMALLLAFSPTLVAKKIIYGSYLYTGYERVWLWNSPAFLKVCFSTDHGLFSWNPILIAAIVGLFCLYQYDKDLGLYSIVVFAALLYVIGSYNSWDGLSSFGNRYFVSLAALFLLGLACFLDWSTRALSGRHGAVAAWCGTAILIAWNLGLVFQWGMHLIPERGPISFRDAAYNQVMVVPENATRAMRSYFLGRKQLMDRIETGDVNQIKSRRGECVK